VLQVIRKLPKRESFVIEQFYGLQRKENPRTLEDIGRRLGVSKERARQLRVRALLHLRELLPIPS
jgi:RNA polymerase primary sigma factor